VRRGCVATAVLGRRPVLPQKEQGACFVVALAPGLADETGAVGRYGNLSNLTDREDETLADVIRSRRSGASQIRQLQTGHGELTLGELSNIADSGDREAIRAIKMPGRLDPRARGVLTVVPTSSN
jgi:hypothetical protein